MKLVREGKPALIRLRKNLTRSVKQGHAWLFSDAIELVPAESGTVAILVDRNGETRVASGIYDPGHALPLRICRTEPPFSLDDDWLGARLRNAAALRTSVFDERTTGYRLVAGEGDGLPGLIIDVYDRTAVLKLDGGAPESFYQPEGIAGWLKSELEIEHIVQRQRGRGLAGQWILADGQAETVRFLENGLKFTADVLRGQKTGFFLDQRDNRGLIRTLSRGARVLNLFSFNGGFSVAAGAGGAAHVTSVDIAAAAMNAAELHWKDNCLPDNAHEAVVADVFEFLAEAAGGKRVWDVVISDPPSFAPNEKSRPAALAAYSRLAQACASVTRAGGKLALASCSSHVDSPSFTAACLEGLSRARRKGVLLAERGLPLDHPTPWAMPELRYLKFLLLGLD